MWTRLCLRPALNRQPRLPLRFFASAPRVIQIWSRPNSSINGHGRRENIYTIPNLLTLSRIAACPIIGWAIIDGSFHFASALLVGAAITDFADGFVARRMGSKTVFGSILDPAADKALVTTLTVSLAWKQLLPTPLAAIIIGRDLLLAVSALYYRYISLPHPKTFTRYWDMSLPSAAVHPTAISKWNTAIQLSLLTLTTVNPLVTMNMDLFLSCLQWMCAGTTIWSGVGYLLAKDAVKILSR